MEKELNEIEQLSPNDLISYINDCIKHDFNKLVQLLYRIDVSEQKLKKILQSHPNIDAARLIAEVIIERLAATKATRANFANFPRVEGENQRKEDLESNDLERL